VGSLSSFVTAFPFLVCRESPSTLESAQFRDQACADDWLGDLVLQTIKL